VKKSGKEESAKLRCLDLLRHPGNMGNEASLDGVRGTLTGDTPIPKKFNKQIGLGVLERLKNSRLWV